MNIFFSFILGFLIGILTINIFLMKTKKNKDENYKTVFETVFNDQEKIYKIITKEFFTGLKSKLFINNKFEKDLNYRNIKFYSDHFINEIHNNSINKFLTKNN